MSAPTIEEESLLTDFRDRLSDVLEREDQQVPSFLIRWLRARDLNADQAEKMLRCSLAWRKAKGIDHILEVPLDPYYQSNYPYYIHGHDKYGNPVVFIPAGKWDYRKVVSQKTLDEINYYASHSFENVCRSIKNANKGRNLDLYPITQFTLIADWKGYSYMQFCCLNAIQSMLSGASIFEAHYPEIWFQCLLINCPAFFNVLMMMLKPIFPEKTYNKMSVYGCNRQVWEQACREIIDDSQLQEILKFAS